MIGQSYSALLSWEQLAWGLNQRAHYLLIYIKRNRDFTITDYDVTIKVSWRQVFQFIKLQCSCLKLDTLEHSSRSTTASVTYSLPNWLCARLIRPWLFSIFIWWNDNRVHIKAHREIQVEELCSLLVYHHNNCDASYRTVIVSVLREVHSGAVNWILNMFVHLGLCSFSLIFTSYLQ